MLAWLDDEGRLDRVRVRDDVAVEQFESVVFDPAWAPSALTIGTDGQIYAAVPASSGTFRVVRLTVDQGGKF